MVQQQVLYSTNCHSLGATSSHGVTPSSHFANDSAVQIGTAQVVEGFHGTDAFG